jgi:hypothetical protein
MYQEDLFNWSISVIPEEPGKFIIEEYEEDKIYIIHTDTISVCCTCEIIMDDEYNDSGSWYKIWEMEEISNQYTGKNCTERENWGIDRCKFEISRLAKEEGLLDPMNLELWK